jgi:hypothetical protein
MKNKWFLSLFVLGFVLIGCSSIPKPDTSYMGSVAVTANNCAVLFIEGQELTTVSIDKPAPKVGFFVKNIESQVILLLPGEHSVSARYYSPPGRSYNTYFPALKPEATSVRVGIGDIIKVGGINENGRLSVDPVTITHNFIAGHFYFFDANREANELVLVDETDPPSTWDNDYMQKTAEERKVEIKKKTGL